jgi:hypothetical protein
MVGFDPIAGLTQHDDASLKYDRSELFDGCLDVVKRTARPPHLCPAATADAGDVV